MTTAMMASESVEFDPGENKLFMILRIFGNFSSSSIMLFAILAGLKKSFFFSN